MKSYRRVGKAPAVRANDSISRRGSTTDRPIGNWAIISSQLIPIDLYAGGPTERRAGRQLCRSAATSFCVTNLLWNMCAADDARQRLHDLSSTAPTNSSCRVLIGTKIQLAAFNAMNDRPNTAMKAFAKWNQCSCNYSFNSPFNERRQMTVFYLYLAADTSLVVLPRLRKISHMKLVCWPLMCGLLH